ncbi:hypothetical protein BJY52DRAFT_1227010 [Lactarius psammicola]|nr:hypothetical protein BJY52DRAFT_1227010 [Lactarius psammicola]
MASLLFPLPRLSLSFRGTIVYHHRQYNPTCGEYKRSAELCPAEFLAVGEPEARLNKLWYEVSVVTCSDAIIVVDASYTQPRSRKIGNDEIHLSGPGVRTNKLSRSGDNSTNPLTGPAWLESSSTVCPAMWSIGVMLARRGLRDDEKRPSSGGLDGSPPAFPLARRKRCPDLRSQRRTPDVVSHSLCVDGIFGSEERKKSWARAAEMDQYDAGSSQRTNERGANGVPRKQDSKIELKLRVEDWRGRGPEFEHLESELEFQLWEGGAFPKEGRGTASSQISVGQCAGKRWWEAQPPFFRARPVRSQCSLFIYVVGPDLNLSGQWNLIDQPRKTSTQTSVARPSPPAGPYAFDERSPYSGRRMKKTTGSEEGGAKPPWCPEDEMHWEQLRWSQAGAGPYSVRMFDNKYRDHHVTTALERQGRVHPSDSKKGNQLAPGRTGMQPPRTQLPRDIYGNIVAPLPPLPHSTALTVYRARMRVTLPPTHYLPRREEKYGRKGDRTVTAEQQSFARVDDKRGKLPQPTDCAHAHRIGTGPQTGGSRSCSKLPPPQPILPEGMARECRNSGPLGSISPSLICGGPMEQSFFRAKEAQFRGHDHYNTYTLEQQVRNCVALIRDLWQAELPHGHRPDAHEAAARGDSPTDQWC